MWDVENLPDEDAVFYRVHKNYCMDGELNYSVFREIGDAMSVDWSKYSTPIDSVSRANRPEHNGIISLIVMDLRLLKLAVYHSPSDNNRSHSSVKGNDKPIQNDTEVRFKLKKLAKWEIPIC